MDDTEEDSRYEYGSSNPKKIPFRENSYSRPVVNQYSDEDEDEEEEEEEEGEEDEEFGDEEDDHNNNNGLSNGYPMVRKDAIDLVDESESESESDDDEESDENRSDGSDSMRHPRKRKLKSLISSYEFAPRAPPAGPTKPPPPPPPSSSSSRNALSDWTEQETAVLLDSWGDRYLRRGRKSLRSEEWHEVAEKVSEVSESERTETQCRNRLDTLKKKYKKEKLGSSSSKWAYFKKMDLLLSTTPSMVPPHQHHQKNPKQEQQNPGLSCGLDSGEYVFMNPRVYLNRANGLDEMRDSPGNSESDDNDDGEGSDGLPPKKRKKYVEEEGSCSSSSSSSFRLIANSIKKFSEVYEKIEASKRQQMVEIEKMRMDFQRDLEEQKRQIMERAQSEIAKIRRGDDDDEAENGSG